MALQMSMTRRRCTCCHDARIVSDINGTPRPCSRCDAVGFNRWADDRRPSAAEQLRALKAVGHDRPE